MEVKNGTPVSIQLRTEVFQENEKTEYFFDLDGQLVQMGDTLYIRYMEQLEGVAEKIPVTIKVEPDGSVHLLRGGAIRTRLKFTYQERRETNYQTEFGMLQIATFTTNLRVSLKDRPVSGSILIDYDILAGDDKLGVYHFEMTFTA